MYAVLMEARRESQIPWKPELPMAVSHLGTAGSSNPSYPQEQKLLLTFELSLLSLSSF